MDADLDDLLDDFSTDNPKASQVNTFKYEIPSSSIDTSQQNQNFGEGGKCYPLFIGGSSLQEGFAQTSLKPRSCAKLRCYKCDKKVHRYIDQKWKSTVDYLFFRNYNTNTKELVKVRESLKLALFFIHGAKYYLYLKQSSMFNLNIGIRTSTRICSLLLLVQVDINQGRKQI